MTFSEISDGNFNVSNKQQLSPIIIQQIAETIKRNILEAMHQQILPAIKDQIPGIIEETIRQYDSPNKREERLKRVSELVRQGVDIKEEGRIGTLQMGIKVGHQQERSESTYRASMVSDKKQENERTDQRSKTGE